MNILLNDLKYAIRNLSKSPGFVGVAIITLALPAKSLTLFHVILGL